MRDNSKEVSLAPFRRLALQRRAEGISWSEMARRIGWFKSVPQAETTRLKRALGVALEKRGKVQETTSYKQALLLCKALDIDPTDVGL